MENEKIPALITAGLMARMIGEPLHRILHVLKTRAYIRPSATGGGIGLYSRDAVAHVRHELTAIDAKRSASVGGNHAK